MFYIYRYFIEQLILLLFNYKKYHITQIYYEKSCHLFLCPMPILNYKHINIFS